MSVNLTVTRSRQVEGERFIERSNFGGDRIVQERGVAHDTILTVELTDEQWNAVKRAVLTTI